MEKENRVAENNFEAFIDALTELQKEHGISLVTIGSDDFVWAELRYAGNRVLTTVVGGPREPFEDNGTPVDNSGYDLKA